MKLIASDVDGTLIKRYEKKPDKSIIKMIGDITDNGDIFAIATGRSYTEIKRLFPDSARYLCICCDGAVCVKNEFTVYEREIKKEYLEQFDRYNNVVMYGKYMTYIKGDNKFLRDCKKQFFSHAVAFDKIHEIHEPVYKAVLFRCGGVKYDISGLDKIYGSYDMSEYVSPGTDKCNSLLYIINKAGINKENCIVFGDGENDVSMLRAFRSSYAMAWASPKVKACACHISDGVPSTIKQIRKGTIN